ncbi:enoyl-CoA hydratase [Pullulanibacillus sp. KACC 23026]|uniref:enoyl-CoA hydratase n=1 Tax=Pullulanibacillus sp. KACC 23026 TaxID=3028315 RepID=UPI0023B159CF|nr:enoyl-CoA hydratase [Pullulanibacillus sp. KACC 23026]WEG13939.1 enoyl-CoA hydratase [Pullulanibacillus sp. KACC 23026]
MTAILRETFDQVAVLTLNKPPANALSRSIIQGLSDQFDHLAEDPAIKAVVLRGDGRFFSAGADIKEFTEVPSADEFSRLATNGQDVFKRIETFTKPVIAAIHGAALGGGLELSMACHIRIAETGTKFGLPELNLGLIPGFAGTQRLPRLVGVPKATEMILTSTPIDAEEALRWGLVNRVVETGKGFETALELAQQISKKSAVSVQAALRSLQFARQGEFEKGSEFEAVSFGKVFASEDAKEGIAAFMEKRSPQFKDR